jgi:hypothetical protein
MAQTPIRFKLDLHLGVRRPEPSCGLEDVGLVLVRLARFTNDLAIGDMSSPASPVLSPVNGDLHAADPARNQWSLVIVCRPQSTTHSSPKQSE